jgi:aminobenzoyl-glutamate utilization protein B
LDRVVARIKQNGNQRSFCRTTERASLRLGTIQTEMKATLLIILTAIPSIVFSQRLNISEKKAEAINYIERRKSDFIKWNDEIWKFAEPSLQEINSSSLLIDVFKKAGFTVQENVSGFSTVFIASYGNQGPVIGLFGEYDADAGASNKTVPYNDPIVQGGYGHGGHHNVLGVGSCGAALAIKHLIDQGKLKCTIRYYGTTAEGGIGSKSYLARDGYFNDLDLSLYWHPAPGTWASTAKWDALIESEIVMTSARYDVLKQQSQPVTLDALEEIIAGLRRLRKQMTSGIKINYSIWQKADDLKHITDTITIKLRIQCAFQRDANAFYDSVKTILDRTQEKTRVSVSMSVRRAKHQFLPSVSGTKIVHNNIGLLGTITYDDNEQQFVKSMQKALNIKESGIEDQVFPFNDTSEKPEIYGYSSDIGDVSWIAPEIYFTVRTLPAVPMHQWPGTAFSAHSIAHKGMIYASKLLSMTIIEFVESREIQHIIRNEFEQKTKGYKYTSHVPALKK